MLKILGEKLWEAAISVLPVSLIVVLLNLTPLVNFTGHEIVAFIVCSILLVLGIALFSLGAALSMTPMGEHVGHGLAKSKKVWLLLLVCFVMGLLITVSEPDLTVLAEQVAAFINPTALIVCVGVGVGIFLLLSVMKIVYKKQLSMMLIFFYMMLFAIVSLLAVSGKEGFLALGFDSGGVTTGPITVPFIMALGVGIASTLGGKNSSENSFGLVAMCSVGPILAVLALGLLSNGNASYEVPDYAVSENLVGDLLVEMLHVSGEVLQSLGLIVAFFALLQILVLKLPKKALKRMAVGLIYTFAGLVIFLSAVNIGFMPVGYKLGTQLAQRSEVLLVVSGLILGAVVVLAEPAVQVLNKQVEEVTAGTVSKRSMMIALSVGVGISIGLSMLRIALDFNILYYLVPGYMISLGLSFFVPGIYTAIAFDSGGVASGPLTSTFILPLAVGACCALQGEGAVLYDAFGIVAMVAMTPLITIQLLGFRAVAAQRIREKVAFKRILDADDEQIIRFM